jgi:hypothetical protein
MRSSFTVNTTASDDTYAYGDCTDVGTGVAIDRFRCWWPQDRLNPFTQFLTSGGVSGQQWLIWMPYEQFYQVYKFGVQQSSTGQPIHVSVDDQDQIVLGPNPNGIYTVRGMFQRGAQPLTADGTTPDMPADFHDIIVYYAMERYAANSVAPEVLARAKLEGGRLMRALEQSQLPQIRMGRPLA